jgi:hypothetical protein
MCPSLALFKFVALTKSKVIVFVSGEYVPRSVGWLPASSK